MAKNERYLYKETVELEDGKMLTVITSGTNPSDNCGKPILPNELTEHELSVITLGGRPNLNNWSD